MISDSLSFVHIRFETKGYVLAQCLMAKMLVSMFLVRFFGCPGFAIKRAHWLSSYNILDFSCSIPISSRIDLIYRTTLATSKAAIKSAFVELSDTVVWNYCIECRSRCYFDWYTRQWLFVWCISSVIRIYCRSNISSFMIFSSIWLVVVWILTCGNISFW